MLCHYFSPSPAGAARPPGLVATALSIAQRWGGCLKIPHPPHLRESAKRNIDASGSTRRRTSRLYHRKWRPGYYEGQGRSAAQGGPVPVAFERIWRQWRSHPLLPQTPTEAWALGEADG